MSDTELKLEDVLKDKNFTVMTRLVRLYYMYNCYRGVIVYVTLIFIDNAVPAYLSLIII